MKGLLRVFAASREKDWIGGSPIRAHAKARRREGRSEAEREPIRWADPTGSGRKNVTESDRAGHFLTLSAECV